MDIIDKIIDYEQGTLSTKETVALFQELINSGQAWQLQGHYGRTADTLIKRGICQPAQPAQPVKEETEND